MSSVLVVSMVCCFTLFTGVCNRLESCAASSHIIIIFWDHRIGWNADFVLDTLTTCLFCNLFINPLPGCTNKDFLLHSPGHLFGIAYAEWFTSGCALIALQLLIVVAYWIL